MAYRKVTTAEQLGRKTNKMADGLKKIRQNLKRLNVPDNVHLKEIKDWGVMDPLKWGAELSGQGIKLSGGALLWLMEYMTRGFNKVFVDNSMVRNLEQVAEGSAKKVENSIDENTGKKVGETRMTRFVKKHPWVLGYLTYWTMLVASFGGAAAIGNAVLEDDKDAPKKEVVQDKRPGLVIMDADGAEIDTSKPIELNPQASNFIDQCVALENITCIPIIYTETYREEPVVQRSENVWTHGFGMTWSPDKDGNMTIRDYADTQANKRKGLVPHKPKKSANMDVDIEQTQSFLRGHVYPKIQKYMKRPITESEFYAICVAGYQLEGHIDDICKNLNNAKTPQEIADAFITRNYAKYGGTPKRRWVCGMLASGYITMQDILNADVDNFYRADLNTVVRNGHFVTNQQTIDYVLGLSGPGEKKTSSVVRQTADGRLALQQMGGFTLPKTVPTIESDADKQISESMSLLLQARVEYRAGRLEKAAELYEQAIAKDADNMEAYSSLALTYKKLGDKNRSINYYEKCIAVVKKGNVRMNANKSLLLDRAVKASSYYNAGQAREEMAKIYKKKGNISEAKRNYRLAIKNYETALENAKIGDLGTTRQQSYQDAIDRVTQQLNSLDGTRDKRSAYIQATQEMRKKNARADLLLYGKTHNGNMA